MTFEEAREESLEDPLCTLDIDITEQLYLLDIIEESDYYFNIGYAKDEKLSEYIYYYCREVTRWNR